MSFPEDPSFVNPTFADEMAPTLSAPPLAPTEIASCESPPDDASWTEPKSPSEVEKISPMMLQWRTCKKAAGDALLLFRMGDFYEAFYEDATMLSKEAEVTLTCRQGIPMSGIPWHTSEGYVEKLISKGLRVAIAEQTEDPKLAKGIVKREVVRVLTPGTLTSPGLLSDKSNNFFATVTYAEGKFGLAFLDISTAEFRAVEFEREQDLLNDLFRIRPAEALVSKRFQEKFSALLEDMQKSAPFLLNIEDDWRFGLDVTQEKLISHFKVHTLDGFGLKDLPAATIAAGAMLSYIQENLCLAVDQITELSTYNASDFMTLDRTTQRNLELTEPLNGMSGRHTLLATLDSTLTPMGGRLLKQWLKQPLLSVSSIQLRQKAVKIFVSEPMQLERLRLFLESVKDLERLAMRVSSTNASPRDLVALKNSLEPIPQIKSLIAALSSESALLLAEGDKLKALPELTQLISQALVDAPPFRVNEGAIFRPGYSKELDELREICHDSKAWIARYQATLREESGIKTLKVGYTRMFGYFIEISKGQAGNAPENFQRRQTLVNGERFITPELKEYESKVLTAEEKIIALESTLFGELRQAVAQHAPDIVRTAQSLAVIDAIQSFAHLARQRSYSCPDIHEGYDLHIDGGKHPVIEALNIGEPFVANDVSLNEESRRLLLITGPNMAGKSTYIRQTALLVIMAQIGSFIPAKMASIGIIDKVFTRIGASDDLSRGQSTFMVEMTETANILNNATSRSLVLLDEIGRGTSTYDGISIAWAVAEHLLTTEGKMAKTLFATHYWELTKLEDKIPGAINYTVAVHESADNIVFLRKIIRGGTDKSYGIHVGRLAGLPPIVVSRATEILHHLEENSNRKKAFEPPKKKKEPKVKRPSQELQLTFFG
jgi:DNA mismatch repair protein MutS